MGFCAWRNLAHDFEDGQKAREMSEAAVITQRPVPPPLAAASSRAARSTASLGCVLLLAAGCTPTGNPERPVNPPPIPIFAGSSGGSGVAAMNGAAGFAGPTAGTAGWPPVGAGSGMPVDTAGGGSVGPGPTGGVMGVPMAGTGGVAPLPDGGLPAFDAGTELNRNQVRPGGICARLAAVDCAAEAHCCAAPATAFDLCKSQLTARCTDTAFLDEIAMNNVSGYSVTQAEAVFNRLEQFAATCDPTVGVWFAQTEGLRAIFQGTVAPAGTCRPSGLPSVPGYYATLASCTQPSTHACLFTGDGPATPPQTATCAARSDVGATCFVDTNCRDGLYCANPQMKYSQGTCTPLKAVGATCTADTECMTFTCRGAACIMPTSQTAYCLSK